MIIANSSPLVALGRMDRLDILEEQFGKIYIPSAVYQEAVVETSYRVQRAAIQNSIQTQKIIIVEPTTEHTFRRNLHAGERGVLSLALEKKAKALIIDDKKARNEANELGLQTTLFYTSDILKGAEKRGLIESYFNVVEQLRSMNIYLPE